MPRIDLMALDAEGRRLYCRDGHGIDWTGGTIHPHWKDGGLCSAGHTWQMKHVGYGKGARWRLEQEGEAGWDDKSGHFRIDRKSWYAVAAHEVGDEVKITFNCSHGHYTRRRHIGGGEDSYDREWPAVVVSARSADDMRQAVQVLTELGWDLVTGDRIRCPDCITEEAQLDARLAALRARDEAAGLAPATWQPGRPANVQT